MSILFHFARPVKSARRPFGLGIITRRPGHSPVGPSASDRAWAAYELNKDCRDYTVAATAEDRHLDRLAEESAELDRVCRGIVFA